MKKIFIFIILVFLISGCEDEKKFSVPSLSGRVVDVTKEILSQKDINELEISVKNFEKTTGGQFAVCIVPNINGETIESASIKIAEKWKIGQKGKDNGILFLLSVKEREFRIQVGYGLQGKLNDAKTGNIGRKAIEKFKNKKWKDGIKIVIVECSKAISGKASEKIEEEPIPILSIIIMIILLVVLVLAKLFCDDDGYRGGGSIFGRSSGGFSGGGGSFGGGGFSGKF